MTTAVALLRSAATKLARARQLHPRPPLRRGLHGGASSGAGGGGGSLSTPPTTNEMIQQGMEGMTANASKTQPLHPDPTINKDLIIEDLRRRLSIACAAAGIGAATITGTVVYLYFWVKPDVEARSKRMMASGRHGKHLNGTTGKGTSVEELAQGIKDIRAKVDKQAALRKDHEAA